MAERKISELHLCKKRVKDYSRLRLIDNERDKFLAIAVLCNPIFDGKDPKYIAARMDVFVDLITGAKHNNL